MSRVRLLAALLAAAIISFVPATASAQVVALAPEGPQWKLTAYGQDGELVPVPFGVSATLMMFGGQATGSGGCNSFSGTYQLAGPSLAFGPLSQTLEACVDPGVQAVEDAYLAALPQVASWTLVDGVLQMNDASGRPALTFEVPGAGLTSSELEGLVSTIESLQASIASLRQEVRRLNVERLRERVRALETTTADLQDDVAALGRQGNQGSQGNGFTQAEGILLGAIPPRIASTCVPARSGLPVGTLAAVACQPNSNLVSSLVYHLMEGDAAAAEFGAQMVARNVPQAASAEQTCLQGVKSQQRFIGHGVQAEGCFRESTIANMRVVDMATNCRQLNVGDTRLQTPSLLISAVGTSSSIGGLAQWMARGDTGDQLTSISQPIARPRMPLSPGCTS
jgi:heat shock protein HslJ